jgi:hypothetical protein
MRRDRQILLRPDPDDAYPGAGGVRERVDLTKVKKQ